MYLDYGLIDFDIYSDGNGAWMNRASSLGKANDGYYLRYGYMTEQLNVNITNTVPLNTTGVSLCYDVATVTDRSIMVDCFNADTSKDIFYLFDEIAEKASGFPFDNDLVTDSIHYLIQSEKQSLTTSQATGPTFSPPPSPAESETKVKSTRPMSESISLISQTISPRLGR